MDIDIDSQTSKREEIITLMKKKYDIPTLKKVINIGTFTIAKSKSAVQAACKGIGLDTDTIDNIKKLATHPTISDCLNGNAEEGLEPIKEFINEIKKYEGLEEAIKIFEGLVVSRSQHASGVLKFDRGILNHLPIMKTNGGILITQYDQGDCEYVGSMKIDLLSLSALDKMDKTIQLLQRDNKIEKGLSKKEIYNKYLHPRVLEWNDLNMYELLYNGDLPDAFQYDSDVGKKAIAKIKPHNIDEISIGNSLMRLSAKGEPPLDKFVRFKNNINEWYKEMEEEGLTKNEMDILKEHLSYSYGIANTQEDIMEMAMNPKIASFTLAEANKLRKAIAKLKAKDTFEAIKNQFYFKGMEAGQRKEFLDYVWNKQFAMSFNYAFSRNHCKPYSVILLQELNLAYRFGAIYWKTAILSEKIGSNGDVAVAVGNMASMIKNPDINLSDSDFKAYEKENKILYGLLSINGIGSQIVENIINNRPYNNIDDVFNKLVEPKLISLLNLFTLAKAGCFDDICNKSREQILIDLVLRITPINEKLTMTNMRKIAANIPEQYTKEKNMYWFRNIYLKQCKKDSEKYYAPMNSLEWINENLDITYSVGDMVEINIKELEKAYKKSNKPLQEWLKTDEAKTLYHKACCRENWNLYCLGDYAKWEMDTIYYYSKYHELDTYNLNEYFKISNFNDLELEPVIEKIEITKKGKEYRKFKTYYIAGTVVNKNKDKGIVYLLTQHGIVVPLRIYDNQYKKLDKKIVSGEGNKKIVLDASWFERGTLLVVKGYRKMDNFIPRTYDYKNSSIIKIEGKKDNKIILQYDKKSI